MQRILFLDFDGVLHPAPYELIETDSPGRPRARAVAMPSSPPFIWLPILEALLEPHPDVRLVVHSSWRGARSSREIGTLLNALQDRYLGVTDGLDRWGSIQAWVEQHGVRDFRILDDFHPAFGTPPPAQLIACPPILGLSDPGVQQALRSWLEGR